ncbi:MAG: EVE domain-containing protein [Acidobacteriota bacterium]|nr:EVE domain-containing protein [Acidobacteriota bacterium]MDH3784854.1 EVE domain-containing protein [Acidobacteriota bacterium]
MATRFWLFKSDPDEFGLSHLMKCPEQTTLWDGVRNYQARNYMREMKSGDGVLFYHSQTKPPAVVAIAKVVREAYPDPTQFDPLSKYHDAKSSRDEPRWSVVDIRLESALDRAVTLPEMREEPALTDMELLRKGSRLSIQPVRSAEWKRIRAMGRRQAPKA